jgi:hypothetical protein
MKVVKDHPNEEIRLNAFIRIGNLLQLRKVKHQNTKEILSTLIFQFLNELRNFDLV